MNRRRFGQVALVGVASASMGRAFAAGKGKGGKGKVKGDDVIIGVQTYSFRDRPRDEAIAAMVACGLTSCELYTGHVEPADPVGIKKKYWDMTSDEKKKHRAALLEWRMKTPLSFFEDVSKQFKKAGIEIYAYNLSFKSSFADEEIDRGMQMAIALGTHIMTASAQQDVVPRIARLAKKNNVRVGMHNHSDIKPNEFATPDDLEKAIALPGAENIAINLDIGHFTAANFDAVAFLKKHHDRIVTLHIKDRKRNQGDNVVFGTGDTPIKEVLGLLRDNHWKIAANIEYEYEGKDTVEEVKRCVAYCKQVLGSA